MTQSSPHRALDVQWTSAQRRPKRSGDFEPVIPESATKRSTGPFACMLGKSLACSHYTKELWQICSGTIRNLRIWRPPCYSFTPQIYIIKTASPISGKRYQSTVWKPGYCYVSTWNLPVINMICFSDTGMTNPRSWQNQNRFSSSLCCLQVIV